MKSIIQVVQNDLIRQILNVQDIDVLKKVKSFLESNEEKVLLEGALDGENILHSQKEVIDDWEEVCKTILQARKKQQLDRTLEQMDGEL